MAKTSKKSSKKNVNAQQDAIAEQAVINAAAPAPEAQAQETPAAEEQAPEEKRRLLIVFKTTHTGRYYVYFQGVAPAQNVGCGCKTAQSAIRYMHLLRKRHNATIDKSAYDKLKAIAATEG